MRYVRFWPIAGMCLLLGCDNQGNSQPSNTPAKNDTGINRRDQSDTKTPIDQTEDSASVKTTAEIRQKVVNHNGLSVNARNVKIITENGHVTLRGPVESLDEKEVIGRYAVEVAGAANVDNQIEVIQK